MNWKWQKTTLSIFTKSRSDSWRNQLTKKKSNFNLFQDSWNKKPESTIKWWLIKEISRESLMGIWPRPEFSSESSQKNLKESTAFTSKLWQTLMSTNMKMTCCEKSWMFWRANFTRPKQTTKIKWADWRRKWLCWESSWPTTKSSKSKWTKQSWPWEKSTPTTTAFSPTHFTQYQLPTSAESSRPWTWPSDSKPSKGSTKKRYKLWERQRINSMPQRTNWKLPVVYWTRPTSLTLTLWATLRKSKRRCFCSEMKTKNSIKTTKTSRKSTESWKDNSKRLRKMSKGSLSSDKASKTFKTFSSNSAEGPPLPPSWTAPSIKSETFLALLEWDKLKNSVTLVKWNLALPMMCRIGSRSFRKTKTKENELECHDIFTSFS